MATAAESDPVRHRRARSAGTPDSHPCFDPLTPSPKTAALAGHARG
jgi:hypothetical protein